MLQAVNRPANHSQPTTSHHGHTAQAPEQHHRRVMDVTAGDDQVATAAPTAPSDRTGTPPPQPKDMAPTVKKAVDAIEAKGERQDAPPTGESVATPDDPPPSAPSITITIPPPTTSGPSIPPSRPPPETSPQPIPLLCSRPHAPSRPHPTQDLVPLYGLGRLAASVARIDPVTKEKINRLRKSYEGQVKNFGLSGRNKAVAHGGKTGMGLEEMVQWPDGEWAAQKVADHRIQESLGEGTAKRLLAAVRFEPGAVPRNDEWEHLLGIEKAKPLSQPREMANGDAKRVAPASGKAKANGIRVLTKNAAASGPDSPADSRPQRSARKRSYHENSFEGYGEGFVDDPEELDAGAYSSDGGSRKSGGSRKKRRKDSSIRSPPPNPYGTSMHRGTGIGAYGR